MLAVTELCGKLGLIAALDASPMHSTALTRARGLTPPHPCPMGD